MTRRDEGLDAFGPDTRFLSQDRRRGVLRGEELQIELPDVGSGAPLFARSTHTYGLYATGGNAASPALPSVPSRAAVLVFPTGGYTFQLVGGDKVVAYTTAGAEVPNLTDLSGLGAIPVLVVGQRPTVVPLVGVPTSWRVAKVQFLVGAALTFDASNYWTVRLQVVRRGSGDVEELGAFSTAAQSLAAGVRYDLLAAAGPAGAADLMRDDVFQVRCEETGHAPALVQPIVVVRRRRF